MHRLVSFRTICAATACLLALLVAIGLATTVLALAVLASLAGGL